MKRTLLLPLLLLSLLLLSAMPALAAEDITVYVTVTDNGSLFPGENSGEPIVAYPVTVARDATVDDVLRALHSAECAAGAGGYRSNFWDFYGQQTWFLEQFFGKAVDMNDGSTYAVSVWRNHDVSSTLQSSVRDGDRVDVQIYTVVSSMNYSYLNSGLSYFNYFEAEAAPGEVFTVSALRSVMDMTTFLWNVEGCTDMTVYVNGIASNFAVAADGSIQLQFDEAGTYYLSVGGNPAYGGAAMKLNIREGASFSGRSQLPPPRLAASGLEEGGGEDITVYVNVADQGAIAVGQVSGSLLAGYPVTVPSGATVDDVLDALTKAECPEGEAGYSSAGMEMSGTVSYLIQRVLGRDCSMTDGGFGAAAFLNHDPMSTIASPVSDGDTVDLVIYNVINSAMFQFENYGICYFDYPQAKAAPGETVTLKAYTETMNFMSYQYQTATAANLRIWVNGEETEFVTDSNGQVQLSFEEAGEYCILAGGVPAQGCAIMQLTVEEGSSFSDSSSSVDESSLLNSNLSAPGNGTGDPITVYVTLTDNGDYARSEVSGEYLISVPVTVPGGSTLDDVLQAFHKQEATSGVFGYSSYTMDFWGSPMYSIGNWFGKQVNVYDGSDYAVTAWLNRDPMSTLASKVSDGDCVDAIIYSVVSSMNSQYKYWGLSYFDFDRLTAGVGEEITLHAYNCIMNPTTFSWDTYVSQDLQVYSNGQLLDAAVGTDGVLKLSFSEPGEYAVLATGNEGYAAAAVLITVEEGASFSDAAPISTPNAQTPVTIKKLDYSKILRYAGIAVVAVILALALVRILRKDKKKEDEQE